MKRSILTGNREGMKIPGNMQAYPPAKRSLIEFKNTILMRLYNTELRKTCLFFLPKEIQHENKIKAVLDNQLVNLKTYNTDPRSPSHEMAGLRITYSFKKNVDTRSVEMLKTGQVPMDVNAMLGLVMDELDTEDKDDKDDEAVVGGINTMQGREVCFFCKKISHM